MVVSNNQQGKNWCFTINNWTPDDETKVRAIGPSVEYLIFGRERGTQNGTPHLQGFVRFKGYMRFTQVKKALPDGAHIERAKGTLEQASEYCEKEGDFEAFGSKPVQRPGKRTDLQAFQEAVRNGELMTREVLYEQHGSVVAKYPTFVRKYLELHAPKIIPDMYPLRPWQAKLYSDLCKEPHKRQVIFVVDIKGNGGKSWFADYVRHLKEFTQVLQPTGKKDMAFAYDPSTRIFFLDCPRSKQQEFIQYDFLEQLKDGRMFVAKYDSYMKEFIRPHVVVLMNEMPDETKLSSDRYDIRVINEN